MKIKYGAIVTDGRGKLGGHVASKNKSGNYLRTKVTPLNPATPAQIAARARLAAQASRGKEITIPARKTWQRGVSAYKSTNVFGDNVTPSWNNLFQKLNNNLVNIGVAELTNCPAPVAVSVFATLSLAAAEGAGTMVATVTPATLPADEKVIVRATGPQSPGKNFVKSEFRQIAVLSSVVAGSIDLASAWEAKFGDIGAAGEKVFVEFIHVSSITGQQSQAQQCDAVIAA